MNKPRTSRIPAPFYAAAGAGDLAYESLRRLPAVITGLGDRATITSAELREKGAELRGKAVTSLQVANRTAKNTAQNLRGPKGDFDVERLRAAAIRNAAVVLTNAQAAQRKAVSAYGALVTRGERLIGSGVVQAAETVNADLAATDVAKVVATPARVATVAEATPAAKKPGPARARKAAVPADTPSAKLPKSPAKRTPPQAS